MYFFLKILKMYLILKYKTFLLYTLHYTRQFTDIMLLLGSDFGVIFCNSSHKNRAGFRKLQFPSLSARSHHSGDARANYMAVAEKGQTAYGVPLVWPMAYYWKTFGVFLVDLSYNRFEPWFTAAVVATAVLNVAITPWSVCALDGDCNDALSTTFRRLYTRMMACTSVMSRASVVYKARRHLVDYRRREDAYESSWPLSGSRRREFRAYASAVVTTCLVIMVPANLMWLYRLYGLSRGNFTLIVFFLNVYVQNWSMCCMETQFALLCFAAYLKFRSINDELSAVRADVMADNRYPVALRPARPTTTAQRSTKCWQRRWWWWLHWRLCSSRNGRDSRNHGGRPSVACEQPHAAASVLSDPSGRPLETVVETLRVRHGLARDSVVQLNDMFGGQLTLSLIVLCTMTLFDIYNEMFHARNTISRSEFIYSWMLQYVFRFSVIIITAHNTTQEVTIKPRKYSVNNGAHYRLWASHKIWVLILCFLTFLNIKA